MLSQAPRTRAAGITLIESLIVLAVSAIVLAAGVPAFGRWVRDLEIRRSAAALSAALQIARAEAVARNAEVRLSLSDAAGRTGWLLSCVRVSSQCPDTLRRQTIGNEGGVRWGASLPTTMPGFGTALTAGTGLPARISFNALGAAPDIAAGTAVARIDVTHADDPQARRLIVQIAAQGVVRVCDPAAATGRPERCE
jgi:type IV fimbrial biogenesis protein FimT